MALHPDRLLPSEPGIRAVARRLYDGVTALPILSPHGHTDPRWYADDAAFPDPASLFVKPDHYVFRMLYSQGVRLEDLGIARRDGGAVETDGRKIWRLFARHWPLFRGTPTRLWFEDSLERVFGISVRLDEKNADRLYDARAIAARLAEPDYRPREAFIGASTSKRSRRPTARSTISPRMTKFALRAGAGGSCRLIGRISSSTPTALASAKMSSG